ncbi:MAG: isoleucine--tRNA ligase [Candidatus Levybacteria bacterium]|nr:isoleucine--tRNA ligase [Candidatus Levybacteria bacterium]
MFKPVNPNINFPEMERELLKKWIDTGIIKKYLHKNDKVSQKFSFLDGPITANNPMGVHHAWGRTYKDLWQRFWNMRGCKQRFQNGFDEQGLWVEVEVEKELGLKTKKDIENLVPGDKFKSLEKFINLCKERVKKYSGVQTEQSKRLGYFMDWDNSYHTSSDENNYAIWNFLKVVNDKGWLYKGHDTVPWCPRCGTAISQHEILTEDYKELTHKSVFFKLPLVERENEYLLVWTTTPWTIPGNVAAGINPKLKYVKVKVGNEYYYLAKSRLSVLGSNVEKTEEVSVNDLLKFNYTAPFDNLPRIKEALGSYKHGVVNAKDIVTEDEGTGILHVAPGAGEEDFKLAKELKLPVIELIDEAAYYLNDLNEFSGKNAKKHPEIIFEHIANYENGKYIFRLEDYKHRYPICWRCKSELVWRVVDEWYIAMDKPSKSKVKSQKSKIEEKTYREQMVDVTKKIKWLPKWGLDRELDWLKNMHDWLISKKRYWGLALPIWECQSCGNFVVVGSREELKQKANEGWEKFDGHTPHRPWIDEVKIKCAKCGKLTSRIPDVGNPWLDAGIVPFSTMPAGWFPADFITESFPGQFKNWFYSLIAMSTALKDTNSFKTVLGFASVRDEKGEEMHKSKGNAIEFNEAADKIGVDVMRWLYLRTNPEHNVNFGYKAADDIRRLFYLRLWNVYSFFVMYAVTDSWSPNQVQSSKFKVQSSLDRWILSKLNQSIKIITESLKEYNSFKAAENIENFIINDLSNWYVRRIRDRVGPQVEKSSDKENCYQVLWTILTQYSSALAPFIPFVTDEIYTNLTGEESVHLSDWIEVDESLIDNKLEAEMENGIKLASCIHAFRKDANIKVRIPFRIIEYEGQKELDEDIKKVVLAEVNVYELKYKGKSDEYKIYADVSEKNLDLLMGKARDVVRMIQGERKKIGARPDEMISVILESYPQEFEDYIKKRALIKTLQKGDKFCVSKL